MRAVDSVTGDTTGGVRDGGNWMPSLQGLDICSTAPASWLYKVLIMTTGGRFRPLSKHATGGRGWREDPAYRSRQVLIEGGWGMVAPSQNSSGYVETAPLVSSLSPHDSARSSVPNREATRLISMASPCLYSLGTRVLRASRSNECHSFGGAHPHSFDLVRWGDAPLHPLKRC